MMNCQDVTRRANDALDGTLGFRQRLLLQAHLLICNNCRRYVAQLGQTFDLVRGRRWAGVDEVAEDRLADMFTRRGEGDRGSSFTCS
jgi:hypothetical protein